jgi:hypothetical protein
MLVTTTFVFAPLQGLQKFNLLLSHVADDRSVNYVTNLQEHGSVISKRNAPLKIVYSHSFHFPFLSFFSKLLFISYTENKLYIDWTKRHFIWQPKIYRDEMSEDTVVPGKSSKASYTLFMQTAGLYLTKGNVAAL